MGSFKKIKNDSIRIKIYLKTNNNEYTVLKTSSPVIAIPHSSTNFLSPIQLYSRYGLIVFHERKIKVYSDERMEWQDIYQPFSEWGTKKSLFNVGCTLEDNRALLVSFVFSCGATIFDTNVVEVSKSLLGNLVANIQN